MTSTWASQHSVALYLVRQWSCAYLLSLDIQESLLCTGIEHQPGPPSPNSCGSGILPPPSFPPKRRRLHQHSASTNSDATLPSTLPIDDVQWPEWDINDGIFCESKNITALGPHAHGLARRAARLTLIQEHSTPAFETKDHILAFKEGGNKQLLLGPIIPGTERTGGVGAIADNQDSMFEFPAITPDFQQCLQTGRVIHLGFCCGKGGSVISFFVIYGESGGHKTRREQRPPTSSSKPSTVKQDVSRKWPISWWATSMVIRTTSLCSPPSNRT